MTTVCFHALETAWNQAYPQDSEKKLAPAFEQERRRKRCAVVDRRHVLMQSGRYFNRTIATEAVHAHEQCSILTHPSGSSGKMYP